MPDTRRLLAALQALLADNNSGDIGADDLRDLLVSCHPTNARAFGTYAARPVSGTCPGDVYIASDRNNAEYTWDGAAWQQKGQIKGANVDANETTTSTSYTNLATTGPEVTLVTDVAVIVWLSGKTYKASGTGNTAFMSVAVSGATTLAANDTNSCAMVSAFGNAYMALSRVLYLSGLTAGSNTFTAKYRVDGSTFNFLTRSIAVLPIWP